MSREFIEPTEEGKKTLLIRLVIVFLLICLFEYLWAPLWGDYTSTLPLCEQRQWIKYYMEAFVCIPLIVGIGMIPYARKMVKQDQYPLPGTLVFHRKKIIHGKPVRNRAAIFYCVLFISFLFPFVVVKILDKQPVFQNLCSVTLFSQNN